MNSSRLLFYFSLGIPALAGIVPLLFLLLSNLNGSFFDPSEYFNERSINLLIRSLKIAILSTLLSTLLGFAIASIIYSWPKKAIHAILICSTLSLFIPPYLHGVLWPNYFSKFGFSINGETHLILMLAFTYMPISLYLSTKNYLTLDRDLWSVALLKFNPLAAKLYIIKSIFLPLISVCASVIFLLCLTEFALAQLLQVNTFTVEIMTEFSAFFNEKAALSLAIPYALIIGFVYMTSSYLYQKSEFFHWASQKENYSSHSTNSLRKALFILLLPTLICFFLFPYFVILQQANSIAIYQKAWATAHDAIFNSVYLAVIAIIFILILATFSSRYLRRTSAQKTHLLTFLFFFPFVFPGSILGIGYLKILDYPWVHQLKTSPFILSFLYVGLFFPFAFKIIYTQYKSLPQNQIDSISLSPQKPFTKFFKLELPFIRPSIILCTFIVFCLCLREINSVVLIAPAGVETLALRIFTLSHYGADEIVYALSLIIAMFPMLLLLLVYILIKINQKKSLC